MAEETKGQRTYRRAPQDRAEAEYIHGLIKADVAANIAQLAQAGDHDRMQAMLGYQSKWAEIVKHLSAPIASVPVAQPHEGGAGVQVDVSGRTDVAPATETATVGDAANAEGGKNSRRTPK